MKSNKYKRCQQAMQNVYCKGFGFFAPYHFLVDASFCVASAKHQFDIKDRLAIVLGAAVRPFVTTCVMSELKRIIADARSNGSTDVGIQGASFVARQIELHRCNHSNPMSSYECIKSVLEGSNKRYGICTACKTSSDLISNGDHDLRALARARPGTPLVYLERTFPLLEGPTAETIAMISQEEEFKRKLSSTEAAIIKNSILQPLGLDDDASSTQPMHKRRKIKGPNPLSVKKSTKQATASTESNATRKRKRKSKRSTVSSTMSE